MGINPEDITNPRFRELLQKAEVEVHAFARLNEEPLPPKAPKKKPYQDRLERAEQNTFATWLTLQESSGKLVFDWSRMDRRTTNRKGMPDFRVYARNRVLFGE